MLEPSASHRDVCAGPSAPGDAPHEPAEISKLLRRLAIAESKRRSAICITNIEAQKGLAAVLNAEMCRADANVAESKRRSDLSANLHAGAGVGGKSGGGSDNADDSEATVLPKLCTDRIEAQICLLQNPSDAFAESKLDLSAQVHAGEGVGGKSGGSDNAHDSEPTVLLHGNAFQQVEHGTKGPAAGPVFNQSQLAQLLGIDREGLPAIKVSCSDTDLGSCSPGRVEEIFFARHDSCREKAAAHSAVGCTQEPSASSEPNATAGKVQVLSFSFFSKQRPG